MIAEIREELVIDDKFDEITEFLRIRLVGIELIIDQIQSKEKNNIRFFSRLTIKEHKGSNSNNIKKILAENRLKYDIIVVEPVSASVACCLASPAPGPTP